MSAPTVRLSGLAALLSNLSCPSSCLSLSLSLSMLSLCSLPVWCPRKRSLPPLLSQSHCRSLLSPSEECASFPLFFLSVFWRRMRLRRRPLKKGKQNVANYHRVEESGGLRRVRNAELGAAEDGHESGNRGGRGGRKRNRGAEGERTMICDIDKTISGTFSWHGIYVFCWKKNYL